MKVLFEGFNYPAGSAAFKLAEKDRWLDGKGLVSAVGYYYSEDLRDTVIILPKVFLRQQGKVLKAFGDLDPKTVFDFPNKLTEDQEKLIFEMSTLLYRAISRYSRSVESSAMDSSRSIYGTSTNPAKAKDDKTYLETILALHDIYKENKGFITFVTRYNHSGNSNIHWDKTISSGQALIQDGAPIYMDFVTREKAINLDEEVIVLLLSTLRWLRHEGYSFDVSSPFNHNLMPLSKIKSLIDGAGVRYLNRIRHKYYNDTLVSMWQILYIFYEKSARIAKGEYREKALIIRKFNNVFEDMIDSIITDRDLFDEKLGFKEFKSMKAQEDGKLVDHLYHDKSLFSGGEMIFVGDSKYYRDDNEVVGKSVGKQYTYAKNVIQVNMNHHTGRGRWLTICGKELRYRDSITEGYDFTPNFFIRSSIDFTGGLKPDKQKLLHGQGVSGFEGTKHFRNRLFDRDTLYIQTIDVNFVYVLKHYACNNRNKNATKEFKDHVRAIIVDSLRKTYDFHLITITDPSYGSLSPKQRSDYVISQFSDCRGRLFCPDESGNVIIMALEKGAPDNPSILSSVDKKTSIAQRADAELSLSDGVLPKTNPGSC